MLFGRRWSRRGDRGRAGEDSINAWVDNWNQNPRPFTWHKTADQILDTMAANMQQIPHSRH